MTSSVINDGYVADFYCPMIDARRMEVYSAVYNKQLELVQDISAVIVNETAYRNFTAKGKILFFGNGSNKCKSQIQSSQAMFLEGVVPLASSMVPLAEKMFKNQSFVDIAYFEPFYLKEFMATIPKNKVLGTNDRPV
jgi:tRNA threonylcarbamoyladenosine biosynthesis protein TsaB